METVFYLRHGDQIAVQFQRIMMNWVVNVCLAHHETFIGLDRNSCLVVVSPCDLAFSVFCFWLFVCLGGFFGGGGVCLFVLHFPIGKQRAQRPPLREKDNH